VTFRGSAARAFGANGWAEVARVGAGGDAAEEVGDGSKVVEGLAGFPPGALSWSASGKVTIFSGRVLAAFSSGRGGTDGEAV
jgi:hypothetical protein